MEESETASPPQTRRPERSQIASIASGWGLGRHLGSASQTRISASMVQNCLMTNNGRSCLCGGVGPSWSCCDPVLVGFPSREATLDPEPDPRQTAHYAISHNVYYVRLRLTSLQLRRPALFVETQNLGCMHPYQLAPTCLHLPGTRRPASSRPPKCPFAIEPRPIRQQA